ncbi:DUF1361 domain-containing protein [Clostridium estertheticum]|uniref:DUF1361 domain-containing protein n=1 Tax=Clostridium estertheticum TaxID=238834 RepID=UPI001C0BEB16|nr:DUF1361 domain-containing protein [Clostridium estertheticum]MBU3216022.1 DUF1361 domain-containing protein [Clostridium estertheticum]WAG55990.1 DUF1361 domain-containing protein [Clostridium estertheticum]
MNLILKKYSGILFFMFVYGVLCFFMVINDHSFLYLMLVWNILLATLPLFFIEFSLFQNKKNKRIVAIIFGILWLIFFPNSVYMITDFIHISSDKLVWFEASAQYSINNGIMYSNDIMHWVKLFVIGIGVVYGLLIGMESLNIFYRFLNQKRAKLISFFIVAGVSLISGVGVYIGRFLRFNSWDLLRPLSVIRGLFANINKFAIEFMGAFAGFILIMFLFYVLFRKVIAGNSEAE